jgi:hypothetical protein
VQAQLYQLHGKITNSRLEPLAFASVQVQELQRGTITKEDGTYELLLEEGRYNLVVSMIGYKTRTVTIAVTKNVVQNSLLEEEAEALAEITVAGKWKDGAEEVIRNVIRNKEKTTGASGAYSCLVYIKASQQDSGRRKAEVKKDSLKKSMADGELSRMAMAEIYLQLDYESERRLKESRTGVMQNGPVQSLFYLSVTEGIFNFYNNLIHVPALSPTPFLSPISYSGLLAYKYKTVKITPQRGHKLYTISVKPRQLSNATVNGELTISDSAWVIKKLRFQFPKYHLPEYDFFEVEQEYHLVNNQAWMLQQEAFRYSSKSKGGKMSGITLVTFSDYALHKKFAKGHFGTEVSATTEEAYERDSTFWQTVRAVPLSPKELRFIQYKDSVYNAMHTKAYLDSIDRLTNKVTWKKIGFSGQTFYNREQERRWNLPPLISLYQPFAFGGSRINATLFYSKTFKSRKDISLFTNASYGFRNQDVNGSVRLNRKYNPFNRGFYTLAAGRDFQAIFQGDAWINMLKRSNVYQNNFFSAGHGLELLNGLFLYTDGEIALRRSVSGYKTGTLIDSLLGGEFENNQAVAFQSYNAVYGKVRLQYTPKQRFIREPKEKIILGSRWPTFYAMWRAGIPRVLNSEVDFQYLEAGVEQQINAGLLGIGRYNIKTGSFISKNDLRLIDYQFQRRGDPLLFLNPDDAFQALDSTFPLFKRFYQGHFVHEFNGAFINKVPLLKKLQLREVGGAGFLIAPERKLRYAEAFAGVERVFRWPFNPLSKFKLGVYVVGSVANQFRNPVQFKAGITTWDMRRNRWY